MKKHHKRFDTFLGHILEEHKALFKANKSVNQHSDLLNLLISFKDDSNGQAGNWTDTEIKALLSDLLIAGTDTTSSTTKWVMAELIRHPNVMGKLQQEFDAVVGRDRLVTESDLSSLNYLQAAIKEVLRLHPPIPLSLPRMVIESCEINGYNGRCP